MKKSKGITILIIILILLVAVAGVLLFLKIKNDAENKQTGGEITGNTQNGPNVVEVKEPKIFKGNERPIAVMIDNHTGAVPQAGLNRAYLVYEIIVEGGETRLMAVFKNADDVEKVGPVRSARHYFIDYALENDAIYTHFGWSPQAESDIKKLSVQNINGMYYDGGSNTSSSFWRAKDKYAPHNAATSVPKLKAIAEKLKYRNTSTKESVLKYVGEEVEFKTSQNAVDATTITIPYSTSNTVKYEYDAETKTYVRYSRNKQQVDWDTKEAVTTKNIIIAKAKNITLNDGENKGRQTIDNVKTLEGYYITNGKAIEITCEKTSREGQTIYKDLEGNEIDVSDGNTFIQICPLDSKVVIEPGAQKPVPEQTNTVQ